MRSTIEEVFRVLLAVLIPLASFTTGLQAPRAARGERRLWRRPGQLGRDLLAVLILVLVLRPEGLFGSYIPRGRWRDSEAAPIMPMPSARNTTGSGRKVSSSE